MRIPPHATTEVQAAFRELWDAIDPLVGGGNIDLKGRRVINAGDAKTDSDYATLRQTGAGAAAQVVDELTVKLLLTVVKRLKLAALANGGAHFGIVYVDSQGQASVQLAGTKALTLNLATGQLELGTGLTLEWLARAGLRSPGAGVLKVVGADGVTEAEITAQTFVPIPRQAYTPTNVTAKRDGDFATLNAADVRSVLGTLITDLKTAGLLG